MRANSFFYVSLGILALATAYHLGASTAGAQSSNGYPAVGIAGDAMGAYVVASNGDVYRYGDGGPAAWQFMGNAFTGAPVPTGTQSLGALKAKYR